MPTYEYKCDACGHAFEQFQSITAAPVRKCPACGKNKVKRLLGIGAGVIFKGSGFYETDYRSESYKNAAKADEAAASPATATGDKSGAASGEKAAPAAEKPAAAEAKPKPAAESKPAAKSPKSPTSKKK